MKEKIILFCFMCTVWQLGCIAQKKTQTVLTDSVVVSTCPTYIYPLVSDKDLENVKKCGFVYPLLILNDVVIRKEKDLNNFRNNVKLTNIKNTKRISKAAAEKIGIKDIPKDGVLFVELKKGYYFDFLQ